MDALTVIKLVAGLALLVGGAELLVRGAARIATGFGISPLVVGLTVVAFGTSASELSVSVMAALRGQPGLAFGNVVGSNICNVLLILGLAAVVTPLTVARTLVRREGPLMVAAAAAMAVLALDHEIGRLDGALLVLGLAGYMAYTVRVARQSRREALSGPEAPVEGPAGPGLAVLYVLGGLGMLVLGSEWLVSGAVTLARAMGVSDLVIGLTVVSIGTSLPEVATTVVAAARGERDMAVGNVVGSNIFNVLCVLGVTALVAPHGVPVPSEALFFDLPVMVAACVVALPIFFSNYAIERWEGALLLAYYAAYVTYLVLAAQSHDALDTFSGVMLLFALPLSALAVVGTALQSWRRQRAEETP
ncbi:MAG: calcium/sodium antiporter [Deltaproteobacteria bacterium]|nr:calcium/sodium antiporter [Deltaproteobacteria bacterium]